MAIAIDKHMAAAYAKRKIPLWVPPSEAEHSLHCKHWALPICVELRDWFARTWSWAFAAGYLGLAQPRVAKTDVLRMLRKMNYDDLRANELADFLVDGLPGLYKKGVSRSHMLTA